MQLLQVQGVAVARQLDTAIDGQWVNGLILVQRLTLVQPIDKRICAKIGHSGAQHVMGQGGLVVVAIQNEIDVALRLILVDGELDIVADQAQLLVHLQRRQVVDIVQHQSLSIARFAHLHLETGHAEAMLQAAKYQIK